MAKLFLTQHSCKGGWATYGEVHGTEAEAVSEAKLGHRTAVKAYRRWGWSVGVDRVIEICTGADGLVSWSRVVWDSEGES